MSLRLVDILTYWKPTGQRTGGGAVVFEPGVAVASRNATTNREINRPDGQTELSRNVFYSSADIPVGSRVAPGDFSGDPAPPATGAFRVAEISVVNSMNAVNAAYGV